MKLKAVISSVLLLCSSFSIFAAPIVITDSNQLDFDGDFLYAINFAGSGNMSIGDADFNNIWVRGIDSVSGFSMAGFNRNAIWNGGSNIDTGINNDALESIFTGIVWSGEVASGAMNLAITSGVNYKVQLLFSECCSNRSFAVNSADGNFSEQYQDGAVWQGSSTQGYLSTWNFKATDSELNINFERLQGADTNYHISGLTVERVSSAVVSVPEPGTLGIFGFGLMWMFANRKR